MHFQLQHKQKKYNLSKVKQALQQYIWTTFYQGKLFIKRPIKAYNFPSSEVIPRRLNFFKLNYHNGQLFLFYLKSLVQIGVGSRH